MEFEQYMTQAMETLYGQPLDSKQDVEASIIHCPIPEENASSWDRDFYMATLDLIGKIVDGTRSDATYSSVTSYGFRLDRVIEFMKDNGFTLHGISQFCRTDKAPKISIEFCLDEK
jgi:hypothetical protein